MTKKWNEIKHKSSDTPGYDERVAAHRRRIEAEIAAFEESQQDGTQAGLDAEDHGARPRPSVVSAEPSTSQQGGTAAEGNAESNDPRPDRSAATTEPPAHAIRIMYRDESPDAVRLFDSEDAAKAALSEIRDAMRAGKRDVLCAHLEDSA